MISLYIIIYEDKRNEYEYVLRFTYTVCYTPGGVGICSGSLRNERLKSHTAILSAVHVGTL